MNTNSNNNNNDFDRQQKLGIEDTIENIPYSKIQSQVLDCIENHTPIQKAIIRIIEEKKLQEGIIERIIRRKIRTWVIVAIVTFILGIAIPLEFTELIKILYDYLVNTSPTPPSNTL